MILLNLMLLSFLLKNNKINYLFFCMFLLFNFKIFHLYDSMMILPTILLFFILDWKNQALILNMIFFMSAFYIMNFNKLNFLWLGMEIQSFSLLSALFLNNKLNLESLESVFKYFMISCLASSFIMFFLMCVYLNDLDDMISQITSISNNELISLLIILPLMFKLGLFPFHIWITDVLGGLSLISMYLMSVIPKMTTIFILFKLPLMNNILLIISLMSLFLGAIYGMNQNSIKVLMGFSGMIHSSMLVISLIYEANFIFYLISYLLSLMGFLLIMMNLKMKNFIYEFMSLFVFNSKIMFLSFMFILSLLGFPPLLGFWGKLIILFNLLDNKFFFICFCLILASLISSFFYISLMNLKFNFETKKMTIWNNLLIFYKNKNYNLLNLIILNSSFFILFFWLDLQFMFKFCVIFNH